ncbi:hypothetical protein E4U14_008055 [Claviceps sp. LM454 group G7]|nr:hypothetical protein E4U14_008055 [Claviceps sp. LM454 group G7]
MSDSSPPIGMGSPKGSLSALAFCPKRLDTTRLKKEHDTARRASKQLTDAFKALQSEVEPYIAPDQELPEVDPEASLRFASLGIELALQEKETTRLERELIASERDAGSISPHAANKQLRDTGQRYYSAGDDLWRHKKKKMRLADPGLEVPILDIRRGGVSDCILALYRKPDGVGKSRERPKNWRRDALHYYNANGADHGEGSDVWCHVSGRWFIKEFIKAAHIVPHFLDFEGIGELLFGERTQSLERAGNALLLSKRIGSWFDNHHIVIVPVDATENPITRWRTDLISPSIMNERYGGGDFRARELDGRELTFHNEKRPVSRFLYFHFFMALVRIRDIKRIGWQDTWARYYGQRPFPTPGPYLRKSLLMALACHFDTSDLEVVNSWMTEHGFDAPLQLTDDELVETARRVHLAVEDRAIRAECGNSSDDESDDGSDNNDSSEEED